MQTKYAGRFTLIAIVVLVALFGIFPPGKFFDPKVPWDQKLGLKAGIDIQGGTRLEYSLQLPPGAAPDLLESVISSLKKRVDPYGVRNLVWRALPPNRIEVRMPMGSSSKEAEKFAQEYAQARKALEATNVRWSAVESALALSDPQRSEKLKSLAEGSGTRQDIVKKLPVVYDRIQDLLRQEHQPATPPTTQAAARPATTGSSLPLEATTAPTPGELRADIEVNEFEPLKQKFIETNVNVDSLEKSDRDATIKAMQEQGKDFPQRLAALGRFSDAYSKYSEYKGSLTDVEELKHLLTGSGVLEFHILVTDMQESRAQAMIARLKPGGEGPLVKAGDEMRWFEVDRPDQFSGPSYPWGEKARYALAWITPEESMVHRKEQPWGLTRSYPATDGSGRAAVGFEFDSPGASMFGDLTRKHINKPLATILDDKIITAPNINSEITHSGIIEGGRSGYSKTELNYLISTLNAGSLPARLDKLIGERTVQPELGASNLTRGLLSCVIGLIVVVVFLVGYYHLSGVVASVAVLMNMLIIVGFLAFFNATFTLPGIAALVLTLGAAVDANVLIFERLREEQHRGLSLRMALRNAYDRAFSAILDSNAITIITSVVLVWIGSEDVRGFGLTLLIGILSSLFTALYVTRTIFDWALDKWNLKRLGSLPLTYPKWEKLLHPNWDWIGMAWIFYAFSTVFIAAGLIAFFANWRNMFDIEFVSGTSVEFVLKPGHGLSREVVEERLSHYPDKLRGARANPLDAKGEEYEVVTLNDNGDEVREAIVAALGEDLKLQRPYVFENVDKAKYEDAKGLTIFPVVRNVATGRVELEGIDKILGRQPTLEHAPDYVNSGVAILLRHIDQTTSDADIEARLDTRHGGVGGGGAEHRDIEWPVGGDPATAIVLISKSNVDYKADPGQWETQLAKPAWDMVLQTISKPAQLSRVDTASPLVARETMLAAIVALGISCVLIMVYLWLRFGNFKYGSATVVAMLHDVLFIVAALGLSQIIGATAVGSALLVEPFRVNMIMVAALLTVMSYSMIDTIVIFDRVRENRGKLGMLSRQVINDSINQTLSRTLLTAGTTIVTVFAMYIMGGAGIHGFTFALLIGILVGTYSSVAIASPLLLLGKETVAAGRRTPVGPVQRAIG